MKPTAAPTNRIAMVPTMTARSHPRGRAAGALGVLSSCCKPMWSGDPLPDRFDESNRSILMKRFHAKWSPA